MRKIISGLVVIVFLAVAQLAYAHPPSTIKITFDEATKTLTAVIMHSTSNPAKHYISKVDIGLNGKEIKEITLSNQETNASQTITYVLPEAKAGDVISVEGYCSLRGTLTKKITVQAVK